MDVYIVNELVPQTASLLNEDNGKSHRSHLVVLLLLLLESQSKVNFFSHIHQLHQLSPW